MAPSQFTVAILPLGDVSFNQIDLTELVLRANLGLNVIILPKKEIPSKYFNSQSKRYKADDVLNFIVLQLPDNAQRILGVTDSDLETEKGKQALGYAYLHSRTAVYSTWHFSKQADTSDKQLRTIHLITHELGHTFGISDCDNPECVMNHNSIRLNFEFCHKCRRWVDRELKVEFGSPEECFSLAEFNYLYGRLPQAIALYRQAVRMAPTEPLYHYYLYTALQKLEQDDEAEKSLQLAIEYSDDSPKEYYIFGLTCLKSIAKRAEEYFNKALIAAKDPQKIHKLIGQAYREIRHDVEKASLHYKKYLQLGGNDQDVIDWLISRSKMDQV